MDDGPFDLRRRTLPERPFRRPRSGWTKPRRLAVAWTAVVVFFVSVVEWRSLTAPAIGLAFATIAASVLIAAPGGLLDVGVAARRRSLRGSHADEPWLWDHDWNPRGVESGPARRLLRTIDKPRPRSAMVAVQVVFGVAAVAVGAWRWAVPIAVGASLTVVAWRAWREHGVGTMRVSFTRFPYPADEPVVLHVGMAEGGADVERVEFALTRVTERAGGPFGFARLLFATIVDAAHRPPGELPGPDRDVAVAFELPRGARGTRLSARLPEYWVLDVVATTSAGPLTESFLVPVYERRYLGVDEPPPPDDGVDGPSSGGGGAVPGSAVFGSGPGL
jgi:hypothetical protein